MYIFIYLYYTYIYILYVHIYKYIYTHIWGMSAAGRSSAAPHLANIYQQVRTANLVLLLHSN